VELACPHFEALEAGRHLVGILYSDTVHRDQLIQIRRCIHQKMAQILACLDFGKNLVLFQTIRNVYRAVQTAGAAIHYEIAYHILLPSSFLICVLPEKGQNEKRRCPFFGETASIFLFDLR
jgi:hypothetical protein